MKNLTLVLVALWLCSLGTLNAADRARIEAPKELIVIACGSGKLAVYWEKVKGARSYYVYRSTKRGRFDFKKPFAKLSKVQDSYAGSSMKLWVNRGLRNGVEYFYIVRAIGSQGQWSAASAEDSDFVDPRAFPWDSRNPRLIVEAASKEAIKADPDHDMNLLKGNMSIVGPDGYVYERDEKGRYSGHKSLPMPDGMAFPTA